MIELNVPAMSCGHCVKAVTEAAHRVDAAAKVDVDLGTKRVTIESPAPRADFVRALTEEGYTPAPA